MSTMELERRLAAMLNRVLKKPGQITAMRLGREWADAGASLKTLITTFVAAAEQVAARLPPEQVGPALLRSHTLLAHAVTGWHEAVQEQQQQRMRKLAHDIGSPLSSVMGYSYLLAKAVHLPEAMQRYARQVNQEAERLSVLFHAFLRTVRSAPGPRAGQAAGRGQESGPEQEAMDLETPARGE